MDANEPQTLQEGWEKERLFRIMRERHRLKSELAVADDVNMHLDRVYRAAERFFHAQAELRELLKLGEEDGITNDQQ